jgi:3-oxoacyl-[acyl-carrier-protein] synthase-3
VGAGIIATGSFLPERRLTNHDLERMVDTSDEWIVERTGIRERRIANEGEASSDLGARAAHAALERAGLLPGDIDLLIVATGTPDRLFPSTAARVAELLGLERTCGAFDLLAACAGFNYGLEVAARMVESASYRYVLLIGTEVLSRFVNYEDRTTCILFGDGAGAVVIGPVADGYGVLDSQLYSDGSLANLLEIPAGGSLRPASEETVASGLHYILMSGREVFRHAVERLADACQEILARNGFDVSDVDLFVGHQANARILRAVAERIGLPARALFMNIDRYGNTSSASVPIAFDELAREGKLDDGALVLTAGFGSGFVWATSIVRWGGDARNGAR